MCFQKNTTAPYFDWDQQTVMTDTSSITSRVRPPLHKKWLSESSIKVLVVDPSNFSAFTTKQLLMKLPLEIEVENVSSTSLAIKEMLETDYALIVMEFDLKENDAVSLIKQMRKEKLFEPATVVLLAEQTRSNIMNIIEAEPDDLILKPFQMSLFNQRIMRCFNKQAETRSIRDKLVIDDQDSAFREINDLLNRSSSSVSRYWCMKQKLEILRRKNQHQQVIAYTDFLLNDIDVEWVHTRRIEALIEQNHQDLAHQAIVECVEKFPFSVNSYIMQGNLYLRQKEPVKAADSYKQALSIAPEAENALKGLSRTAESTDSYDDALFAVKRLIKRVIGKNDVTESDIANYHIAASLLVRQAEVMGDDAISSALRHSTRYLSEAQNRFPYAANVPTHRILFEAYGDLSQGNTEKAAERLSEVSNLDSVTSHNVVFFDAIVILRLALQNDDADRLVTNYVIAGGNIKLLERIDHRLNKLDAPQEGNQANDIRLLRELAQQLCDLDDVDKALSLIQYAKKKYPEHYGVLEDFLKIVLLYMQTHKPSNNLAVDSKNTFEYLIKAKKFNSGTNDFMTLQHEFSQMIAKYRQKPNAT